MLGRTKKPFKSVSHTETLDLIFNSKDFVERFKYWYPIARAKYTHDKGIDIESDMSRNLGNELEYVIGISIKESIADFNEVRVKDSIHKNQRKNYKTTTDLIIDELEFSIKSNRKNSSKKSIIIHQENFGDSFFKNSKGVSISRDKKVKILETIEMPDDEPHVIIDVVHSSSFINITAFKVYPHDLSVPTIITGKHNRRERSLLSQTLNERRTFSKYNLSIPITNHIKYNYRDFCEYKQEKEIFIRGFRTCDISDLFE